MGIAATLRISTCSSGGGFHLIPSRHQSSLDQRGRTREGRPSIFGWSGPPPPVSNWRGPLQSGSGRMWHSERQDPGSAARSFLPDAPGSPQPACGFDGPSISIPAGTTRQGSVTFSANLAEGINQRAAILYL